MMPATLAATQASPQAPPQTLHPGTGLGPNPFCTPGWPMNPNNLFAQFGTPTSMLQTQRLPAMQRVTTLNQNAIPPQPNTAAYNTATLEYHTWYGNQEPEETQPYPLQPGPAMIGSNECYQCGKVSHYAPQCQDEAALGMEQRYQSIAGSIQRAAAAATLPHPGSTGVQFASVVQPSNNGTADAYAFIPQMASDGSISFITDALGNGSGPGQ
jgi:hypothetical protein